MEKNEIAWTLCLPDNRHVVQEMWCYFQTPPNSKQHPNEQKILMNCSSLPIKQFKPTEDLHQQTRATQY